ncbi:PH domain-containing protein [Tsukamurella serpentis]
MVKAIPSLIPALIGVFFVGRSVGPVFFIVGGVAISVMVGMLPWLTTRWRVTEDQLELRHGLLRRVSATARRDRIRSVDVTAGPIERVLRLRKVSVGTGVGGEQSALVLDPIPVAIADRLSRDLLRRTPVPTNAAAIDGEGAVENAQDADGARASGEPAEQELARFTPRWLRFAPFSLTGFALVAAGAGIGFRILDETGLDDRGYEVAQSWFRGLVELGPIVLIPLVIVLVLVLSVLVSVLTYLLAFWGFRLVRRSDGALHTTRGLISTVAATIERKRVRGISLHEPVLMRIPGGAKLKAVATGTDRNPTLLPPAPRADAVRVADEILGRPGATESELIPHGSKALRRRYTRSFLGMALLALPFAVATLALLVVDADDPSADVPIAAWVVPAVIAIVVLGSAFPLARVRYAHLGSVTGEGIVVLGAGTLARSRTVLETDGVIGFVTSESLFQRRAGVLTLHLATAAGSSSAVDVTAQRATRTALVIDERTVRGFLA